MRSLSVLVLLVLAIPTRASANQCNAAQPFGSLGTLPRNCPFVVYVPASNETFSTTLQAYRDGLSGTLDTTFTRTRTDLDVYVEQIDEACVETRGTEVWAYDRYEFDLSAQTPGTQILVLGGNASVTVYPDGECTPYDVPPLACQDPVQDYWACGIGTPPGDPVMPPGDPANDDTSGGGCHASGNSCGGAAAFALLGVLARRRRR